MKVTSATARNGRQYQEDAYAVVKHQDGLVMAVFDGHGGGETSEYCAAFIERHARTFFLTEDGMRLLFGYLAVNTNPRKPGSTASIVFWRKGAKSVVVGTLGDSPVLVATPSGLWVSQDHNVRTNEDEREATIKRGGIYSDDGYIEDPSSSYGLQMGRALGDSRMGAIISKEPDIRLVPVGEFVCLATDGAFDPHHKDMERAIRGVARKLYGGANAQDIVDMAASKKTRDNVTVIVARL